MATWDVIAERFLHVTDKLGKKIDDGIFDTVVALNMLGVGTLQSCEGHIEWGVPYPWVSIQNDLEQKFLLHQYLARFYKDRSADFDCVLIFHGYRMHSRGAAFSDLFSEAERQQKLKAYQAEMSDFTTFLKAILDRS
ncbi:conserved hypothetical protein [Ktedonobacter racemifer DSM 44963]|uniref:Uncharacterized protein n=2 Tax=Ktedonobacter racemifer TaxID=363277 RepID=D6U3Y3_KTERA|nr:conserved hypothetical protein [Ktedonobacter racemifer DSM 44963]